MQTLLRILFAVFFPLTVTACIWDAQSLSREKSRSHDLAQTILHNQSAPENTNQLRATIKDLEAHRHENDADWWNNLAGSYIRLGESETAVKLLEPVVAKFPDDYGVHANLGTAYHLLGRYQDAEREIARDLEINSNAHFGLEKYHLALLQYLVRDPKYQARHVYVDELTAGFLATFRGGHFFPNSYEQMFRNMAEDYTNNVTAAEAAYEAISKTNSDGYESAEMLGTVAAVDPPPSYRKKWDLGKDSNFEGGVIYMAQMNPKEPACWTMLGIAAWQKRDYHLAATAFQKAIALGSPQSELLKKRIAGLEEYINNSRRNSGSGLILTAFLILLIPVLILYFISCGIRAFLRARRPGPP